jgi:oligoribonuclease NrnB/cAMP/cGMP phosphodiesterase (DHH superfamily)
MRKPLVIYHGDCNDGFAAAYAAWRVHGDNADYHPGRIGEDIPDVDGREVYILDLSYTPEKYEQILGRASKVTLIDHHASAKDRLESYPGTIFDTTHSGCYLAWSYFLPNEPAPLAMRFIEDYDMWAWKYKETYPFVLNLKSYEHDFAVWDKIMLFDETGLAEFIEAGRHIERHYRKEVDLCIKYGAREFSIMGYDGYILNAGKYFTDLAGNILSKRKNSFAIIWHVNECGEVKCSVRSVGNCSARKIAEHFGGGGHEHASAFKINNLSEFLSKFPT